MTKKAQEKAKPKILNMIQLFMSYLQKKIELTEFSDFLTDEKIKAELHKPLRLQQTKQGKAALPLEWAIIYEDWRLVRTFLDAGADPNVGIEYPLFLAISNLGSANNIQSVLHAKLILNLLKKKGIKLDVKLKTNLDASQEIRGIGIVPFILMCDSESASTLKMLLEIFPDIKLNELDSTGLTPLLVAISRNNLSLVKLLYSYNVPLTAVKYKQFTYIPLMWAAVRGSIEMVDFISQEMQKKDFSDMSQVMQEDFEKGFGKWDIERIKCILKTNLINLNNRYLVHGKNNSLSSYMTLMHQACDRGDINIIKLFIDNGGLINTVEDTPCFGHAVKSNRLELIQWLLDSNVLNHESILAGLTVCSLIKNREECKELIDKYLVETGQEITDHDLFIIDEADEKLSFLSTFQHIINRDNLHELENFFTFFKFSETLATHRYFHQAIESNAQNCVKFFLKFCDPFFELENMSAIFLTILERNQTIMEVLVNHFRTINKTKDLEDYLIRCESQIEKLPDFDKYMQFLKKVHRFYFQEITPVSFDIFQSASGHKFVEQQGIARKCLPKISDNKNTIFQPEPKIAEPTWFGGQRIALEALKMVEGASGYQAFVWLQADIYKNAGCGPLELEKFNSTRCSFTAGSANIKKLTLDYFLPMNINGHENTLQCGYELRIKGSKSRIFLFPLLSDCKRAMILIGGEYGEGIHKLEDMKSLMSSNRHGTKMVDINLPVITQNLSLES